MAYQLESSVCILITSDSSAPHWRAVCNELFFGAGWFLAEKIRHINELELLATLLALQSLANHLDQRCVVLQMDNTATIAAINRLGSPRAGHLTRLVFPGLHLCLSNPPSRLPQFGSGLDILNSSRPQLIEANSFCLLEARSALGTSEVGPVCRLYEQPTGPPLQLETESMLIRGGCFFSDLARTIPLSFPSFLSHGEVLAQEDKACLVRVAPVWPTQTWYPALLGAVD